MRYRLEEVLADPPAALLPLLVPLSVLYRGVSALHRGLYTTGIIASRHLPRPVVSVGNLTAGGGGKTPLTMWLAERLKASGVRVAVLTRGYGRLNGDLRFVEPGDDWRIVGDEPALMAAKMAGLTVAVSKNRFKAGWAALEKGEVDLFLLDDGFQHYALKRDLDIVVVDNGRRFGNGRLLPAGILRGPLPRLEEADFIIVTRAPVADAEFEHYLKRYSTAQVLWADYRPMGLSPVPFLEGAAPVDKPPGALVAFCGIAGPESFRDTLRRAGIEVLDLVAFPDHHPFSAADIRKIMETARRLKAVGLVTTEKDAIRWPVGQVLLPVYSLSVQPDVQRENVLLERVLDLARKGKGAA